jgi:hypothetical protein
MKKKSKIALLVFLILLLVAVTVLLLTGLNNPNKTPTPPSSNTSCNSDYDCVPAQCCHPTSCININYKGVCNLLCTQDCSGPLDCGAGFCACVDKKCSVVQTSQS